MAPFVALVAGCLALAQCSTHRWPVVRNAASHRIVAVLGDSLAVGVGASTPDNGFVQRLFDRMRERDPVAQLSVYAVAGATASDVYGQQLPQATAGTPPTDVWLCVGGNDVTHGTSTEAFASTEHTLAAAIRGQWPNAHIVIFGVPDVSRSPLLPGSVKIRYHNDAAADDDAASDAARASEADFVDLFTFSDRSLDVAQDFASDAFHPNDAGYAAIADYAAKVVL